MCGAADSVAAHRHLQGAQRDPDQHGGGEHAQPAGQPLQRRPQPGSAQGGDQGVRAIHRRDTERRRDRRGEPLAGGQSHQVAADGADGHRDGKPGQRAGEQVSDHGRRFRLSRSKASRHRPPKAQ